MTQFKLTPILLAATGFLFICAPTYSAEADDEDEMMRKVLELSMHTHEVEERNRREEEAALAASMPPAPAPAPPAAAARGVAYDADLFDHFAGHAPAPAPRFEAPRPPAYDGARLPVEERGRHSPPPAYQPIPLRDYNPFAAAAAPAPAPAYQFNAADAPAPQGFSMGGRNRGRGGHSLFSIALGVGTLPSDLPFTIKPATVPQTPAAVPPVHQQEVKPIVVEEKEIKAPAKPAATAVVGFPGKEEDKLTLARYVVAQRNKLSEAIETVIDQEFGFIDPHGCGLHGQPVFADDFLARTHKTILDVIMGFCEEKKFNFNVASPLLDSFLHPNLMNNDLFIQFSRLYTQLHQKIKASPRIMDLVQNFTYDKKDQLDEEVAALNLGELFGQLKGKADEITARVITPLRSLKPEVLLAQGPRLDLDHFLTENKGAPPAAAAAPAPAPAVVKVRREPLNQILLALQEDLTREMTERQNQFRDDPEETVMSYGNTLAKEYHLRLRAALNELWNKLGFGAFQDLARNNEDILKFYTDPVIANHLNHDMVQHGGVRNALKTALDAETNRLRVPCFYLNRDGTFSQYEYMLRVSSEVMAFYRTFQDRDKEAADTLLLTFFTVLSDQGERCQAGLVGRMFSVEMKIMSLLIDYYKKTSL